MRRIAIIAASILGTLIVLAIAAPFFIDVERFKPRILAAISEGLGRPVAVDGELSLSLLPRPRLSVAGLSIANAAGFADQPMVRVERLDVEIALMPLLSGDLDVKRLVLRRPDILLEQAVDGGNNWTLAAAAPAADATPEQASPGVKIGRLRLIDGRLVYHDHASDRRRIIEGFDAGLSMDSLKGPFDLEARFSLDAMPISLKAVIGTMNGGPAAVAAEGALGDGLLAWRFEGDAVFAAGAVTGAFEASADDLARLGPLLGGDEAASTPLPARAMALQGRVSVGEQGVRLSDLLLRLGESVVTGLVTIEDGDQTVIAAEFDSARLDIADFTAAPASTEPVTGPFALTLPGDMAATLSLNIARVDGAGVSLSNARLAAWLDDATLHIDRLQAQLPGGDVEASGVLTSNDGFAAFTGDISANMPDLRALLQALAVETAALPAQAYRKAALQGDLRLVGDHVALNNLSGRLDDSAISGNLGWRLRARPAYDAALMLDRLDLDRYAPAAEEGEASAADAEAEPLSLAALAEFDADLAITLGSLIRGNADLGGMAVKASLLRGVLRLDQARLGSTERVMIGVTGTVRDLAAAAPKLDLNLEAAGAGLDRAFTALALPVPESLQSTGAFRLAGTATGTLAGVALDLGGNVGDLAASLKGRLDDLASAALRFDVKVEAQHPNLASLAGQFKLADLPAGDKAAPVRLDATLSGAGTADIKAAGQVLTGADQVAFTLDRRAGAVKASLNARAKELRAFINALGIDYQPAAGAVGALDLAVAVSGDEDALTIEALRASVGDMALSGTGRLMLAGAVPDVDLTLSAGALDIDRLLPPAETGAEQAAGGGARWSDEPLALDWVKAVDGRLSLSAENLTLRGYRFEAPRLTLESRGPVLSVSDLSGRLFGGPATIRASLDVTALPRFSLTLDMTDVPVADLLQAAANIQPATGTMTLNGEFTGQGGSEQAIVASLKGEGHVGAQQGVIRRIDLARVNERLETLSTVNDFIRLTGTALKGGETAYRHLGFDIVADQGKLNSRNFTADVDGADIGFTLRSDLPAWTIDAAAQIKLQSNAAAPPIGATIVGDLDSPVISYQTKALEKWVSARLGAAVLKGVVTGEGVGLKDLLQPQPPQQPEASAPATGDTSTGADASTQLNGETPAPAPTAPPPAKKPEEEIRDLLLKGLFGKKKSAPAPE